MKKTISTFVVFFILFFVLSCKKNNYTKLTIENPSTLHIGYSARILNTVARTLPDESNGGLERYPVYGTTLAQMTDEEKDSVLAEDVQMRASSSTYNSMDQEGNLYLDGVATGKKLYKHTASNDFYYGNLSDTESAVKKEITYQTRGYGNYITGLYAPAGEIVTISLSEEDLSKTGGLTVSIGQCSPNNGNNNIWKARDFNRMPNQANFMDATSTTTYVGNYLGGPIYVTPKKSCKSFTVTISGACEYAHFIYGYTTKDDLERYQNLSAPYFDLEIWDTVCRHSGPKRYANFDYENLCNVSQFWTNVAEVSHKSPAGSNINQGITFLYDPFIAAGAAVAFVGANWCNLPPDWMEGSINYKTFTQKGMWGTIHEFNHHYQKYGFHPGDEVTNNAISICSYILYTNISSTREKGKQLDWWNNFLIPSFSLTKTNEESAKGNEFNILSMYTDIIHTFGVDKFLKATAYGQKQGGTDIWYESLCETMGYKFDYYFETILHREVSSSLKEKYKNLPEFIPVATIYQTGRSINYNGKINYSNTVREYEVLENSTTTLNFNEDIVVPNGFTYTIKSISKPGNGTIRKIDNNIYEYVAPSGKGKLSGVINLELTITNGTISQDVTLNLGFKTKNDELELLTPYSYYSREYTIDNLTPDYTQSIESINYGVWDNEERHQVEKAIDGDLTTAYHSERGKYISQENPLELVIDLQKVVNVNTLFINGYNGNLAQMPVTFKLYGGTTLDNLKLLGDYNDLEPTNRYLEVSFDTANIRYYKLVITKGDHNTYIAIAEIGMTLKLNGKELSPNKPTYYNFNQKYDSSSSYGYYIEGNGYFDIEINSNKFGIFTNNQDDCQIEITIDGKKQSLTVQKGNNLGVLIEGLTVKSHKITVKVIKGTLTIDRFVI